MPSFVPVLMSDISQLKAPVDIMKYVLQSYTAIPKNINDTFSDREISFVYDNADVGHDTDLLQDRVKNNLEKVLSSYFQGGYVNVSTSIEWVDQFKDGRYNLIVDMLVTLNGVPYSLQQSYQGDGSGTLDFKPTGS